MAASLDVGDQETKQAWFAPMPAQITVPVLTDDGSVVLTIDLLSPEDDEELDPAVVAATLVGVEKVITRQLETARDALASLTVFGDVLRRRLRDAGQTTTRKGHMVPPRPRGASRAREYKASAHSVSNGRGSSSQPGCSTEGADRPRSTGDGGDVDLPLEPCAGCGRYSRRAHSKYHSDACGNAARQRNFKVVPGQGKRVYFELVELALAAARQGADPLAGLALVIWPPASADEARWRLRYAVAA